MSLKNKVLNYLNTNKSAQGSLVAVVAASVILSVIVASATQWYLAFNKNLNVSGDSLTGMSIAKDIWDKMTTQDFEEMKGKAGTTETSDVGGYTVTREYGQAGVFDESTGECKVGSGSPTADNPRACMDVTIKVTDKDGKQVFTATPTRVSQNLGNYYVKNDNFPKEFKVAMEDEDESVEMPEGKAIYAYVDGQKVPLSSQGSGGVGDLYYQFYTYTIPSSDGRVQAIEARLLISTPDGKYPIATIGNGQSMQIGKYKLTHDRLWLFVNGVVQPGNQFVVKVE